MLFDQKLLPNFKLSDELYIKKSYKNLLPYTVLETTNPLIYSGFLLSDQGSNLDSTEPKSVVLPVTPSDNLGCEFKVFSLFLKRLLKLRWLSDQGSNLQNTIR